MPDGDGSAIGLKGGVARHVHVLGPRNGWTLGFVLAAAGSIAATAQASDWPQYKRDAARTADAADEALAFPLQRVLAVKFPSVFFR